MVNFVTYSNNPSKKNKYQRCYKQNKMFDFPEFPNHNCYTL